MSASAIAFMTTSIIGVLAINAFCLVRLLRAPSPNGERNVHDEIEIESHERS